GPVLDAVFGHVFGRPASAQTSDRPTVTVARTITAEPSKHVSLPIRVGRAPPDSFVRLRGLPATVALSEGHAIAPGTWAVPLNALAELTMTVPAAAKGTAEVAVALVGSDGSVLGETRFTLVISAPSIAPPSSSSDRQRAMHYLQKGKDQLA